MARKRGAFGKLILVVVLVLAAVGGYTIWNAKPTQDGISAAKRTADKAEKAAKAAEKAWK
jgi:hypothetical protein